MAKYSFLLFSFAAVLWETFFFFFSAHPFLAQKGYNHGCLVHFILTPSLFDKIRYSNAQLDEALVNSIELSQLTSAMSNPKSLATWQGEEEK